MQGTGSETLGDKVTLFWSNKRYKLTLPLCKKTNVATINSNPGYSKFNQFCTQAEIDYKCEMCNPVIASPSEVVTDDEETFLTIDDNDRTWKYDGLDNKYINLQGKKKTNNTSSQINIDDHSKNLIETLRGYAICISNVYVRCDGKCLQRKPGGQKVCPDKSE